MGVCGTMYKCSNPVNSIIKAELWDCIQQFRRTIAIIIQLCRFISAKNQLAAINFKGIDLVSKIIL